MADYWMTGQLIERGDPQQRVEKSGIPQIDFGGLDKSLAEVCCIGLKLADDKCLFKDIQVVPCRWGSKPHAGGDCRGIPELAVTMGYHGPESTELCGRDSDSELGDIPLQIGRDEGVSPSQAVVVACSQEAIREAAPYPEPLYGFRTGFGDTERAQLVGNNSPGQTFRSMFCKRGRSGTEDEETTRDTMAIYQRAKKREEFRLPLDFVDNDERILQAVEVEFRILQLKRIGWEFQIKIDGGTREDAGNLLGKGGLARLTWPYKGNYGEFSQRIQDFAKCISAYHACILKDYLSICKVNYSNVKPKIGSMNRRDTEFAERI